MRPMPQANLTPTEALALCRELPLAADGAPPDWILLAAAGEIQGRDGRAFSNSDPSNVVAEFAANAADIPVDVEHSTHLQAPAGNPAPAVGWVTALDARADGVWGQVAWNATGAEQIRSRAYRYYSPAYLLDAAKRITRILSVGLTNTPNLKLPALNQERAPTETETGMPIDQAIRAALDLPEGATPEQAAAKIATLKTDLGAAQAGAQVPDLNRFCPRGDLDAALNRASAAEAKLREREQAESAAQIDALIKEGLNSARITPATVDYHRAQAQTEGGVERLRTYLAAAPAVVGGESRTGQPPEGETALNSEARRIMAAFGNTEESLKKFGGSA